MRERERELSGGKRWHGAWEREIIDEVVAYLRLRQGLFVARVKSEVFSSFEQLLAGDLTERSLEAPEWEIVIRQF